MIGIDNALLENNQIDLVCKRVRFFSQHDENAFFEWAQKIKCIESIKGILDEIHFYVNGTQMSYMDFKDLIGIFYRYNIDMKQLKVFLNDENRELYDSYKKKKLRECASS